MRNSWIVLGVNNWNHVHYFSDRLLNSLSSGVPVLYKYFPGAEDFFKNGVHCRFFYETEEAVPKAVEMLDSPEEERERIGIAGAEIAIMEHSVERRTEHPVVDLSLFKNRLFTAGNLANLLSGIAFAALAFTMTLYYQLVRGYDPRTTGLALIPLEATLILVGPVSGWLSDRYGQRGLSTLGLVVTSVGLFLLAGITSTTPDGEILLWLAIIGLGVGMFRSPNASSVMGSVPVEKRGIAAGVRSTMINTSIVASIPLTVALMTAAIPYEKLVTIIGENRLSAQDISGFLLGIQQALLVFAVMTMVSGVFSALRGPRDSKNYS